jgi:drug/metabolite transporter (DMT)-like permease
VTTTAASSASSPSSGSSATAAAARPVPAALVGAALAVTAWGSTGVLIKHIDMDPLAISVYRFWIYSVAILAWLRWRGVTVDRVVLRHSLPGGLALAADVALFFTAVKETTIVNATVIGALQPLIVGAIAWRFFGERIGRRNVILGVVSIAGVVVVVLGSTGAPEWHLRGDLLAVGALFAWSAYFVFSKDSRTHISPAQFTAGTAVITAVSTTALALALGQDISWPGLANWGWLLGLAVAGGLVGHSLMNWSLVRIPLWLGSVFTLLVPVVGSALAWVFLGEPLGLVQLLAMGLVVGTLALMVRSQTTPPATAATVTAGSPAADPTGR